MTPDKRERAIKYLTEEIRSLRMAPQINGCGPENWADQLEIMETCLQAVRSAHFADAGKMQPLTVEQLREMVGKPVWVDFTGSHIEREPGWFILKSILGEEAYLVGAVSVYKALEYYGAKWTAYAYPPPHIDREAWTAKWEEDGECYHKPYRVRDVEKWKKYKCSKCGYKAGRRSSQKYCPSCGRTMTPKAWAELDKRLRG